MTRSSREAFKLDEFLAEQTDAEAIGYLLALHKTAENHAEDAGMAELRELLAYDSAAMFHVLTRFAPEAMADALAVWEEHSEDD